MQIPNKDFKLKVGPHIYDVKYEEKLMGAHHTEGLHTLHALEMYINNECTEQIQKEIFLHELLHACISLTGLDYRLNNKEVITEEDVVRSISPILLQVIQDNPKIFRPKKGQK